MNKLSFTAVLLAASVSWAVAAKEPSAKAQPTPPAAKWSYDGDTGPEHWGKVDGDYKTCANGRAQSPINIHTREVTPSDLGNLRFDYKPGPLSIVDNGHTVKASVSDGSSLEIGGQAYMLKQFHFHRPSEEQVDGKAYELVAHFVHANAQGQLAVVAVLFDQRTPQGEENATLQKVWEKLPTTMGEPVTMADTSFNPAAFLPTKQTYYHFMGSLTTPPCTENVHWFVLTEPVAISRVQVARFGALYQDNNRPTQPLHARRVTLGGQ